MKYLKAPKLKRKIRSKKEQAIRKIRSSTKHTEAQRNYRASHPFCEICLERDIYRLADHVHHKTPLASAATLAELDELDTDDNRLSVCVDCHDRLHAGTKDQS